jgi:hypothetical protein
MQRRDTRADSNSGLSLIWFPRALIALTFFYSVMAPSAAAAPESPTDPAFDTFKFVLSVIGYLGALTAFFVGLAQYKRADYWKRAEFLAKDLKDFFNDKQVSTALTLMDWGARYVNLGVKKAEATVRHRGDETLVNRALQCSALRPHTILSSSGASESEMSSSIIPTANRSTLRDMAADAALPHSEDRETSESDSSSDASGTNAPTTGGAAFSPEEAAIRDCYDKLLDGMNRYGNYLSGELVSVDDLDPYLGYWIRDVASTDCDGTDGFWSLCLLAYIDFYAFLGVQSLFAGFGFDIAIEGKLAESFVKHSPDFAKATALVEHVKLEKQRTLAARTKSIAL